MHVLVSILALFSGQVLDTRLGRGRKEEKNVEEKKEKWEKQMEGWGKWCLRAERWTFNMKYSLCPRMLPLMGKCWDENLNWFADDWVVLWLKINFWSCSNSRACDTSLIVCAHCHSKLNKNPLFLVMNGKYNQTRKKTSFIWQINLLFAEHFKLQCRLRLQRHAAAGLTYWLRCQQHFITLKHNIAISRHFRIHLLSLSDMKLRPDTL